MEPKPPLNGGFATRYPIHARFSSVGAAHSGCERRGRREYGDILRLRPRQLRQRPASAVPPRSLELPKGPRRRGRFQSPVHCSQGVNRGNGNNPSHDSRGLESEDAVHLLEEGQEDSQAGLLVSRGDRSTRRLPVPRAHELPMARFRTSRTANHLRAGEGTPPLCP